MTIPVCPCPPPPPLCSQVHWWLVQATSYPVSQVRWLHSLAWKHCSVNTIARKHECKWINWWMNEWINEYKYEVNRKNKMMNEEESHSPTREQRVTRIRDLMVPFDFRITRWTVRRRHLSLYTTTWMLDLIKLSRVPWHKVKAGYYGAERLQFA